MLSVSALASMRTTQTRSLNETATIRRPVLLGDGQENQSAAPVLTASNVPCKRDVLSYPVALLIAERLMGRTGWSIRFSYGQDVQDDDEVVIGTDVYQVIGSLSGGAWSTSKRVAVVLVQ